MHALDAAAAQADLFAAQDDRTAPAWGPPGLLYRADFLDAAEERVLLDCIATLPLEAARYKAWTAQRRIASYGGRYDYDAHLLRPAPPVPEALHGLRARVAAWAEVAPARLSHALVSAYRPGAGLGWHRDVPDFELVAGVSLGAAARLRFRPWPPGGTQRQRPLELVLAPRSAYLLRGAARWEWQHSLAPVDAPRWSITWRSLRRGAAPASA